jgi:hypothetical protein
MVSPFCKIAKSASPSKISDPLDIAARYFVYKLCEATGGRPIERQLLRSMGETLEIVLCSVERGWVTLHAGAKPRDRTAALTDEGRRLARKGR